MNTAALVDEKIAALKASGIPKQDAAWQASLLCIGWPYIFGDRGQYCTPAQRRNVYNAHPDQEGLVSKCKALSLDGEKAVITGSCGGCKWYPGGQRVRSYDCRGFTYWVLLQIYGWELMGGGCTQQWNNENNWKAKGTIDSLPEDTLVCLFYRKKENPATIQHTGFYYKGETIECSNGVQHFTKLDKKWEMWGMPACIEGDAPEPGPEPVTRPTLKRGSTGPYVVECQHDLILLKYDVGKTGADGIYGANTEKAVKAFQKAHGLKQDGVTGTATWAALLAAVDPDPGPDPGETMYSVTIAHLDYTQAKAICNAYPNASMAEEKQAEGGVDNA